MEYVVVVRTTSYGIQSTLFTLRGKLHTSMQVDLSHSTLEPLGGVRDSFEFFYTEYGVVRIYTPYLVRHIV